MWGQMMTHSFNQPAQMSFMTKCVIFFFGIGAFFTVIAEVSWISGFIDPAQEVATTNASTIAGILRVAHSLSIIAFPVIVYRMKRITALPIVLLFATGLLKMAWQTYSCSGGNGNQILSCITGQG